MKIILASQSPRRKQLLQQAEIDFEVVVVPTNEIIDPLLPVVEVPVAIAMQKAHAVLATVPNFDFMIAADTIVVINNEILGKPKNEEDAVQILHKLSGKTHEVITGVVILKNENNNIITHSFYDTTKVEFNNLSQEQIRMYVQKYQPYDKAGAYAIQEWIGVVGIKKIDGCFYNVMGLPVSKILPYLTAN